MQKEVGNTMPDIDYFWLGYYRNGMTLKGLDSIKNIPKLDDIRLLEVYIKDKRKIIFQLGVGIDTGFFYINDIKVDPAPFLLSRNPKPLLRPIFFMVRQQHFKLFSDGHKEPIENDFYTAGIRVGWQTTIENNRHERVNIQKMMTWMEGWNRVAIHEKR